MQRITLWRLRCKGSRQYIVLSITRRCWASPRYGLSWHCTPGTVIYGNVDANDRLDFTVIGPAVNLVGRVGTVAKALDEPIVVTDEFAQAYSGPLRSLRIQQFRGVAHACELFAPAATAAVRRE